MHHKQKDISFLLAELNAIGIALSVEKNHAYLLEMIITKAMDITNADGGTLYLKEADGTRLDFAIVHNKSLGLYRGGSHGTPIDFQPIELFNEAGEANHNMVSAWVALHGETVNVDDVYTSKNFDFSGTRALDKKTGYRSISFLTVPMKNHANEVIGVLQLINAMDDQRGQVVPFNELDQQLAESLASQAAVTLSNKNLIESQKELFDALIQLIASAIDEKSPYTAKHCRRVPVITKMLADAVCKVDRGPLKDFSMTDEEQYELEVAAWLHDCGKITTPEYVIDKQTKLETIFDRIHLVDTRFEILKRDAVIAVLKDKLGIEADIATLVAQNRALKEQLMQLDEERDYIRHCNRGGESMSVERQQRVAAIAKRRWTAGNGDTLSLLTEEEVNNLQVKRGTLNAEEREIINNHVSMTIKMLKSLPYPKHLVRVPEYAGGHHERMDGSGYPNRLTGKQLSIPARMIAIADVFEALTASDRPYKKSMPLSRALQILEKMRQEGHIDPDLFDVFVDEKVYLKYAKNFLPAAQIDVFESADFAKG